MPWFSYGYFVRRPDRTIVPAGQAFSPTPDAYKVGDSLGVKGDTEGFVIGILNGRPATLAGGYDVFVLVEERRAPEKGASPPPPWDFFQRDEGREYIEDLLRGPKRLVSRPQIQANLGDYKFRAVGKKLYRRPVNESFHDFQLFHLFWLLDREWHDAEMAKASEDRHAILKWREERNEQLRKYQDPNEPVAPVRAPFTGGTRALQVLADDLYQLTHAFDPPKRILARLRDIRQFQGARHEILTASLFARCGFDIEFIDDEEHRNPEFFATKNGERIAVEAKSRHRAGVLNERGAFREDAPAEIRRLYESAAGQNPGDCPFLIFIDVNLPLTPEVAPMKRAWVLEAMKMFADRHAEELQNRDTALFLTNFGWHFSREELGAPGETAWALAEHPKHPLREETWDLLVRALTEYGRVVDEEGQQG
jgi:hypothetical protein